MRSDVGRRLKSLEGSCLPAKSVPVMLLSEAEHEARTRAGTIPENATVVVLVGVKPAAVAA